MQDITQGILFLERVKTGGHSSVIVARDWNQFFTGPLFGLKKHDAGRRLTRLFPRDGGWLEKQIEQHIHQTNFEWEAHLAGVGQCFRISGYRSGSNHFVLVFAGRIYSSPAHQAPINGKGHLSSDPHPGHGNIRVASSNHHQPILSGFMERVESADEMLTSVLTKVSHGIRTPLNGVIGFAQYLKSRLQGEKEYEEYFGIIIDNAYRLLRTVNNMIYFFRLETGQVKTKVSECLLNQELDKIASEFSRNSEKARKQQVVLEKSYAQEHGRDKMLLDSYNLYEILDKLLDNAFKYTEEGVVKLSYDLKDTNTLLFRVKDSGPGIQEDHMERIFQEFRQSSDLMDPELGGVGLGLAIARELVTMMGGEIFLESAEDEGSCFSFTLPFYPVSQQVFSESATQAPARDEKGEQSGFS